MNAKKSRQIAIAILGLVVASATFASEKIDRNTCTFGGKKLYGKIQVVTSFPDVKIQVVSAFPELKVEKVESFPTKCGQWQLVKSFPDTKIQFVNSFPDVKVEFVSSFPGLP